MSKETIKVFGKPYFNNQNINKLVDKEREIKKNSINKEDFINEIKISKKTLKIEKILNMFLTLEIIGFSIMAILTSLKYKIYITTILSIILLVFWIVVEIKQFKIISDIKNTIYIAEEKFKDCIRYEVILDKELNEIKKRYSLSEIDELPGFKIEVTELEI